MSLLFRHVIPFITPLEMKINAQQAAFAKIVDANTIINKILGQRSTPKPKINLDYPAAELEKSSSISSINLSKLD